MQVRRPQVYTFLYVALTSELVKSRKRKLSDLYYLTQCPTLPLEHADIEANEDGLMVFLEKNDLENGRFFQESTLPLQKSIGEQASSIPRRPRTDSPSITTQHGEKVEEKDNNERQPLSRPQSVPASIFPSSSKSSSDVSTPSERQARKGSTQLLPAARLQRGRKSGRDTNRPFQGNITAVDLCRDASKSEVVVLLVPDRLPEPPQSRRTLAELYYTTQTLPLSKLLPSAHKTLSTDSYQLSLLEGKLAVVHSRIEELKRSEKWSLRQMSKFRSPFRSKVHWDHLLDEMKWMQIDFKEERKLKIAICYEIALAVDDYWRLGKEPCCVSFKPIRHLPTPSNEDVPMTDERAEEDVSMTDEQGREQSEDHDIGVKEQTDVAIEEMPPMQSVNPNQLIKRCPGKTIDNSLIPFELPRLSRATGEKTHQNPPFKIYMKFNTLNSASKEIFDLIPEMPTFNLNAPYINEFDSLSLTSVTKFLAAPDLSRCWQRLVLESETTDVPLLASKNSQSIHAYKKKPLFLHESHKKYHAIRAPQPPNIKYLEYRTPTIWLPQDDQKLLKLVKDFQYNWNIVSMHMLPNPTYGYSSNIERRTPWQCFERWHQLNPNFPLAELKGPYAQAAQAWMDAAIKVQALTKRRIAPLGVGTESIQRGHRRLRWASMFDGIRKSMRKRENVPKQNNTYERKSQLPDRNGKVNIPTPVELSKMKHERDKSIAEAYAQQQRNAEIATSANSNPARPAPAGGPSGAPSTAGVNSAPVQPGPLVGPNPQARASPAGQTANNGGAGSHSANQTDAFQRQMTAAKLPQVAESAVATAAATAAANGGGVANNARISTEQLQHMLQLDRHRQLLRQQAAANANNGVRTDSPSEGGSSPIVGSPVPMGAMPPVLPVQGVSSPNQHLANLVNQISAQYPTLTSEQVTKLAYRQIQRYMVEIQRQQQQHHNQQLQQHQQSLASQQPVPLQVPPPSVLRPPQQPPQPPQQQQAPPSVGSAPGAAPGQG